MKLYRGSTGVQLRQEKGETALLEFFAECRGSHTFTRPTHTPLALHTSESTQTCCSKQRLFTHLQPCSVSPAVKGGEGWHSRGSANLPHALHVAQPLKYCSLWREARSQSLQQFTPLFSSAPPLCFLCLCPSPSFSVPHTPKSSLYCVLPTGSLLSLCVPLTLPFLLRTTLIFFISIKFTRPA